MPDRPRHALSAPSPEPKLPVVPDTPLTEGGPAMEAWLSQCKFVLDMYAYSQIDAYSAINWLTSMVTFAEFQEQHHVVVSG